MSKYNPAHVGPYIEMTHRITQSAEEAAAKIDVEALPRRTAHALHALICTTRDLRMPAKASEIIVYDEEALSVQQTAAGLRHAQKLGLALGFNGLWTTTFVGGCLRYQLEDRYLRETKTL